MKLRGLYAVTPDNLDHEGLFFSVEQALVGGAALLQYRRKRRHLAEAREVVALGRRYDVPVIVNDTLDRAIGDVMDLVLRRADQLVGAA